MSVMSYNELESHFGHKIVLVKYGNERELCIECETCNEVLLTYKVGDFPIKPKELLACDLGEGCEGCDHNTNDDECALIPNGVDKRGEYYEKQDTK